MLCVSKCGRISRHIGMSPSGKAPDFDSGIRRFKSCHPSQLNLCSRLSAVNRSIAPLMQFEQLEIHAVFLRVQTFTRANISDSLHNIRLCDIVDPLAQSVEQLPFKQWVRGSSPRRVTKNRHLSPEGCRFLLIHYYLFTFH